MHNPSHKVSLVLLAGPPRSGTTWLNREICSRPGAFGFLPECTLIAQQIALYSRTRHYCDKRRFASYFGTTENLFTFYRDSMARMLDLAISINVPQASGMLVLKDPELSLYLDDLGDILPDHKLVALIRDPRDVLASVKKVTQRTQEAWDMEKAATWIFSYYHGIEKHRPNAGSDRLFVRYEDLVAGGLDKVRAFLNQPTGPDGADLAGYEAVRSNLDPADPFFSALYLEPTSQKMVGSFTQTLTGDEIRHIESVFSGVMDRWGYR